MTPAMLACARDATGKSGATPALPPQLLGRVPRQTPLAGFPAGKAPWATTPSQETSASPSCGTIPRAEEEPLSLPVAGRLPAVTLILGGARSGKSRYAETLVL